MSHHDIKTLKAAQEITGKLSNRNSKMPGSTFAISAKHCNVGGKLVNVKGSVCDRCYAIKLQNLRPSVDKGWTANYLAATTMIASNPDKWAAGAAFQINRMAKKSGEMYHRWFDSGDLASVDMLAAICKAAVLTPEDSQNISSKRWRCTCQSYHSHQCHHDWRQAYQGLCQYQHSTPQR